VEEFAAAKTAASYRLGQATQYTSEEFASFGTSLAMSGQESVDVFLEHRAKENPRLLELGKLAIAYCLVPYEQAWTLFRKRENDWYEYLFKGLNALFEEFSKNRLSIVTFNYDRSLEHYLLTAIKNSYGKSDEESENAFANIKIVHAYGQLGPAPYPDKKRLPYMPHNSDMVHVKRAAEGIKLYTEAQPALETAHKILREAEAICFLGFGFLDLNVSRLAISSSNPGSKMIFGTAKGLIGEEVKDIRERISKAFGSTITLSDADNLTVLRQHRFFR
jgi:hypothetical protein